MSQTKKSSSPNNKRDSIEELKIKYESSSNNFETPKMSTKPKSPKKLKKSKVRQMASLFNSKMSQLIKRDNDVRKYATLVNELSPEPMTQTTANLVAPVPKPRTHFTKPKAPVPSPRTESLNEAETSQISACFVAEDMFAKLSVKDKAKFYIQFVEEMSKTNPQFGKQAQLMEVTEKEDINLSGGVIVEKQATVKDLLDELEFNKVFPKPINTKSHVLQRMDSMKRALAARKNLPLQTSTPIKAKEFEDILQKKKPTNQQKVKSLPRITLANEQQLVEDHQQVLTTNAIFQNQQVEDLFFSWFKEKHVKDDGIEDMSNQSEVDEEKQKSAIDQLLEEAIAKLEVLEVEQNAEEAPRNKSFSCKSSAKSSETEESESGLSSLPKNTSEESQTESQTNIISENEFVFVKPLKPLRKRKLRRNAIFKKDNSQNEVNQINSTDSETDSKLGETKLKNKKLFVQTAAAEEEKNQCEAEEDLEVLNESLMKIVNSPRKIKSAYTLTVLETPLCTPRQSINFAKTAHLNRSCHNKTQKSCNTLTDQGFETATNDNESPVKRSFLSQQTNSPLSSSLNKTKTNFDYSTPIKTQEHHSFAASASGSAKQLFSPIAKPMKIRRKSFYDMESRRNSLAMEVIKEDQPFETQETYSSNLYNQTEQTFIANVPNKEMPKESTNKPVEKFSQFWIKCADFSIALEINYNDAVRLRLLYEIFSQTSCETKDLHFGIDNQKFSVHDTNEMVESTSSRIQTSRVCSHYWFSTGDLTIPFSGKYLSSHKVQRIFRVIKEAVEETGILRFGIDEVEFSNVPEFWYQPAKFSVESQYSMLVGLQSGDSNGLEGRSKYAWPHSKPVMISDLDETDNFEEEIEGGRLSFAPFGSYYYNLASLNNEELSMPRNSQAMMSLESYCDEYENEPLEQLFDESQDTKELEQSENLSLPQMVYTVENQQQRLSDIQEHLAKYVKPSYISKDTLDALKGSPEYVEKLKEIVADISNIGCSNHFKSCSIEELESYMHFLNRYDEICVSSCSQHIDTVLEALVDYKAVVV